jgi:hypothetical protein
MLTFTITINTKQSFPSFYCLDDKYTSFTNKYLHFYKEQIYENMKKYCLNADIKKRKKLLQIVLADSAIHVYRERL